MVAYPFRIADTGGDFGKSGGFTGLVEGQDVELRGTVAVASTDESQVVAVGTKYRRAIGCAVACERPFNGSVGGEQPNIGVCFVVVNGISCDRSDNPPPVR